MRDRDDNGDGITFIDAFIDECEDNDDIVYEEYTDADFEQGQEPFKDETGGGEGYAGEESEDYADEEGGGEDYAVDADSEAYADDDDICADEADESEVVYEEYTEDDFNEIPEEWIYDGQQRGNDMADSQKKKMPKGLIILYSCVAILVGLSIWIAGTPSGRHFGFGILAGYLHRNVSSAGNDKTGDVLIPIQKMPENMIDEDEIPPEKQHAMPTPTPFVPRSEDYVKTFLFFGIEEIAGDANTDAMILVSINSNDKTIKLTSIMRDTYVSCPGYYNNKINTVYARAARKGTRDDGAKLLISVIEPTFDIKIDGYACVNFSAFKSIIDRLGGVDIELGDKEATYLNKTNYIEDERYRNVKAGMNHLNGEQALGYCRVRKVATLGGVGSDYGRTLRQRRLISAMIEKYKNSSITEMISIMNDCLGYVYTNLTTEQITDVLEMVVTNRIFKTESFRLPVDDGYVDSGKEGIYNGNRNITYTLVLDGFEEMNKTALHRFVFNDPE